MARKLKKYPVNNVPTGADYYYKNLLNTRISRFKYDGLPDTIPQEILERQLIERGTVAIFSKAGEMWALPVNEYGVGVYPQAPPEYITANPILHNLQGATDYLKSKGDMIYNNTLHLDDTELLKRYSMQLAQVDSTIDISLVNLRAMSIGIADSEKEKQDFELFYRKLSDGDISALVSENMAVMLDKLKLMPTNNQLQSNGLRDLYNLRNNIYRQFLRECGIRTTTEKSQFVSGDEIVNDDILLRYNLIEPLEIRKKCLEKINAKYNLNIAVSINPALQEVAQAQQEEVSKNVNERIKPAIEE